MVELGKVERMEEWQKKFLEELEGSDEAKLQSLIIGRPELTYGINRFAVTGFKEYRLGDEFVADLAYDFGYPLIVVAPNVLGVINQTLQTLITAATFRDGLEVAGIILNDVRPGASDPSTESNAEQLGHFCVPPLLAHVRWQDDDIGRSDWVEFRENL